MKNTWTVFAATLLLVFALAACGGDSQTGADGGNGANNSAGDTNTGDAGGSTNGGLTGGQDDAAGANGQTGANNGVTGSNNGQMPGSQNGTTNGNGTANGTNGQNTTGQNGANNGDSLIDDAKDAVDDVGDALTGGGPTKQSHSGSLIRGASFDQMVRNGRVHDTDGILSDMENSVTPGVMF